MASVTMIPIVDVNSLPADVRDKLAELDLELSEGDITQKGYEKKRNRLLAPFLPLPAPPPLSQLPASSESSVLSPSIGVGGGDPSSRRILQASQSQLQNQQRQQQQQNDADGQLQAPGSASPSTKAKRRHHRRVTRHEARYHSEVRQEAVQQAIAAMQSKPHRNAVPMPSKRSSALMQSSSPIRGRRRHRRASDSSSDEDDDDDSSSITTSEQQPVIVSGMNNGSRPTNLNIIHAHQPHHHHRGSGHGHRSSSSGTNTTDTSNNSSPGIEVPPALPPRNIVQDHPRVLGIHKSREQQISSSSSHNYHHYHPSSAHHNSSSNSSYYYQPPAAVVNPQPSSRETRGVGVASSSSSSHHHVDQFRDSNHHRRDRSDRDREREIFRQAQQSHQMRHEKHAAHVREKEKRRQEKQRSVQAQLQAHKQQQQHRAASCRDMDFMGSSGGSQHDNRYHHRQQQQLLSSPSSGHQPSSILPDVHEMVSYSNEDPPPAPPHRLATQSSAALQQLIDPGIKVQNNQQQHHHHRDVENSHRSSAGSHNITRQGSAGSNSSSTSSNNEKPILMPILPVKDKSSKKITTTTTTSDVTSITLADVMQNITPPPLVPASTATVAPVPSAIGKKDIHLSRNSHKQHQQPDVTQPSATAAAAMTQQLQSPNREASVVPLIPNPVLPQRNSSSSSTTAAVTAIVSPISSSNSNKNNIHTAVPAAVINNNNSNNHSSGNISSSSSNTLGSTGGGGGPQLPDYDAVYGTDVVESTRLQSTELLMHELSLNSTNSIDADDHHHHHHRSHDHMDDSVGSCQSLDGYSTTGTGRYKVSAKIQQLLHTLSRPKKRPLPDFYIDDETDLEIAANQLDPKSPKPEGTIMTPPVGEVMNIPAGLPKTLEEALQRYGSATFKAPAVTVLDTTGKIAPAMTYGKLYTRARKIAYNLLNKVGHKGGHNYHNISTGSTGNAHDSSNPAAAAASSSPSNSPSSAPVNLTVKQGDRVALVFPNSDPFGFMCSFYGCLLAGVVAVPIEVPITKRDAGSTQIGFLLGSCNVRYALTSEACFKGLPKNSNTGEVMSDFKGWPRLTWLCPESWNKAPKDWSPPPRISDDVPAYIEYAVDGEGAMKGVSISRSAMMSHCKALTSACNYTEGDVMISVLDFKREVGLWHSVLSSILNGMHIIFIPYSLMKVNPSSWMMMITKFKSTIAICKSRDLHWGLLATKDHKDINLSSLRMLLVADGSNPWSLSSCDQFINVFNARGLKPEALCPCAASPEALTISLRR